MRRLLVAWCLLIVGLVVFAHAQAPSVRQIILYQPPLSGGCSQASAWIARAQAVFPTYDGTHQSTDTTFICGLVSAGIWAKMDVLSVYATQDTTVARLNMVSSSFTGTLVASPSFQQDRGYTTNGSTSYIDTNFIPSTGGSQLYTQDAAHFGFWSNTSRTAGTGIDMGAFTGNTTYIRAFNSTGSQGTINDNGSSVLLLTNGTSLGHSLMSRTAPSGAGAQNIYWNGTTTTSDSTASSGLSSVSFFVGAANNAGSPLSNPSATQYTMMSIGGKLSASDASTFYTAIRTLMTARGVP